MTHLPACMRQTLATTGFDDYLASYDSGNSEDAKSALHRTANWLTAVSIIQLVAFTVLGGLGLTFTIMLTLLICAGQLTMSFMEAWPWFARGVFALAVFYLAYTKFPKWLDRLTKWKLGEDIYKNVCAKFDAYADGGQEFLLVSDNCSVPHDCYRTSDGGFIKGNFARNRVAPLYRAVLMASPSSLARLIGFNGDAGTSSVKIGLAEENHSLSLSAKSVRPHWMATVGKVEFEVRLPAAIELGKWEANVAERVIYMLRTAHGLAVEAFLAGKPITVAKLSSECAKALLDKFSIVGLGGGDSNSSEWIAQMLGESNSHPYKKFRFALLGIGDDSTMS